jgi:HTH-type transcriptional regulator/antitoxin HigA
MMGANEIDKIAARYRALCELVPLKPITTKTGYEAAVGHLNRLLDAGGANQTHQLAGLVEALGEMIHAYEKRQIPMPDAEPREVLRYLMGEHGLKQSELSGIASQGTISDILSGRRGISRALARKMAARFQVSAAVFL